MRIAFVGDSFVNGTGDAAMLGWVGRVCAAAVGRGHDVTCYNLGVRRDRSVDIAQRWRDEVARRLPDGQDGRVVFSFGANDAMRFSDPAPAAETLDAIAAILTHRGDWPMLVVGPPPIADAPVNARIAQVEATIARACAASDVAFLPICARLIEDPIWMDAVASGDGAHPGAAGYGRLAALVEAWPAWRAWLP